MRRGDYRNYYKGHVDKIKGEGGGGEERGRKGIQLLLSNNKNLKKRKASH